MSNFLWLTNYCNIKKHLFIFHYSLNFVWLLILLVLLACTFIFLGYKIPLLKIVSNRSFINLSLLLTCESFFPIYYFYGIVYRYLYCFFPIFLPYRTFPILFYFYHFYSFVAFYSNFFKIYSFFSSISLAIFLWLCRAKLSLFFNLVYLINNCWALTFLFLWRISWALNTFFFIGLVFFYFGPS